MIPRYLLKLICCKTAQIWSTNWFLRSDWRRRILTVRHDEGFGSKPSLFITLAWLYTGSVSSSVLYSGGDRVQAVLPSSGFRSCQCVWLSVGKRELYCSSSRQQTLGRTLQTEKCWRQRAVAHKILQSDMQMYRWVWHSLSLWFSDVERNIWNPNRSH